MVNKTIGKSLRRVVLGADFTDDDDCYGGRERTDKRLFKD